MRYMRGLNEWLETELREVGFRIDELRRDILGRTRFVELALVEYWFETNCWSSVDGRQPFIVPPVPHITPVVPPPVGALPPGLQPQPSVGPPVIPPVIPSGVGMHHPPVIPGVVPGLQPGSVRPGMMSMPVPHVPLLSPTDVPVIPDTYRPRPPGTPGRLEPPVIPTDIYHPPGPGPARGAAVSPEHEPFIPPDSPRSIMHIHHQGIRRPSSSVDHLYQFIMCQRQYKYNPRRASRNP